MLDKALNKMGVQPGTTTKSRWCPWRWRILAEENIVEIITDYMCDCGCCQPILRERRTAKVERPPVAILRADGG